MFSSLVIILIEPINHLKIKIHIFVFQALYLLFTVTYNII